MSRPKGSKNKPKQSIDESFSLTTDQRIELLANLIVERIATDIRNGQNLLPLLKETHAAD